MSARYNVPREYLPTIAGCHMNWGSTTEDGQYLHWIIWEEMSNDYGISADEASNAWKAFKDRHGDTYPNGDWQEVERLYIRFLEEKAKRQATKGGEA